MKDSYNREINYLRISVTDRCNLRCFYCMPEGVEKITHDEILRDEEIVQIVKEAVKIGITKIRITGGDPLVRKGIYKLIAKLKEIKGLKEITLSTNAILLIGNVKRLKDAGVSRINFSLDTLDKDKFKAITKSDLTLDYHKLIKELIKYDLLPIKINAVLLKGINDEEIIDFIELADQYDLSVRFIELMPIGHLKFDYDKYFLSKDDILVKYPKLQFLRKDIVAEYYNIPGKKGKIGFINPISHNFCASCNRLRLTSDGNLKPCLHHNEEIHVKGKSSEEILIGLRSAIKNKAFSHNLNDKFQIIADRPMNKIGG